jgi:hypothetical protein
VALAEIVRVLVDHRVRFLIVGGMAAVLQGAPIQTFDIDVVYALDAENLDRLETPCAFSMPSSAIRASSS